MNDNVLRKTLVELLQGGHAHASADLVLANVGAAARSRRPAAEVPSAWEELEHMRIAQEDIIRYTLDSGWKSPEWPAGYWPAKESSVTDEMWSASVAKFFADLDEVIKLVENTAIDLTSEIPHGEGRTYLRQVLLVADHNSYHLAQIVQARKLLGDWKG